MRREAAYERIAASSESRIRYMDEADEGSSEMLKLLLAVWTLVFMAAGLASVGSSGVGLASAKCGNPKTEPLGTSLGIRGYKACSDGATANVSYKGQTYKFGVPPQESGVCWKDSTLPLNVDIGTVLQKRKKSDPPGFSVVLVGPKSISTHTVDFGVTKRGQLFQWNGPIAITKTGKYTASFKDAIYKGVVNGKAKWTASGKIVTGSYTCKRVLVVPG